MQASHVSTPIKSNVGSVGWVERSDTHQLQLAKMMGFEGLNPSYRTDLPDGLFGSLPVQPCLQKHFRSRAPQIRSSTT